MTGLLLGWIFGLFSWINPLIASLTLAAVPRQELVQPAAVHPVHPRELADRPALAQMCLDQIPPGVHAETPSTCCLRCLDTSPVEESPIS